MSKQQRSLCSFMMTLLRLKIPLRYTNTVCVLFYDLFAEEVVHDNMAFVGEMLAQSFTGVYSYKPKDKPYLRMVDG